MLLKPREKLLQVGVQNLSNAELISILLGSGVKGKNVFEIAASLSKYIDNEVNFTLTSLCKFNGIGYVKAQKIICAIELGRRIYSKNKTQLLSAKDVWMISNRIAYKKQEVVLALYLNARNELVYQKQIAIGTVNCINIDLRMLFWYAVKHFCAGIILVHNHPSGNINPSEFDKITTNKIREACQLIGIDLIDHVIITKDNFTSILKLI